MREATLDSWGIVRPARDASSTSIGPPASKLRRLGDVARAVTSTQATLMALDGRFLRRQARRSDGRATADRPSAQRRELRLRLLARCVRVGAFVLFVGTDRRFTFDPDTGPAATPLGVFIAGYLATSRPKPADAAIETRLPRRSDRPRSRA